MSVIVGVIMKTITPKFIKDAISYINFLPTFVFILTMMSFLAYKIYMMTIACHDFDWYPNILYIT